MLHEIVLKIEEENGFYVDEKCYSIVEEFIEEAKKFPRDKILIGMHYLIHSKFNFSLDAKIELFSECLRKRKFNCKHSSLLYLVIAEKFNLPIKSVFVPNHVFVRWEGSSVFNWETTKGEKRDNKYYIKKYNISKNAIKNSVYLKSLEGKEFISAFYNVVGIQNTKMKEFEKAKENFQKAIELVNNFPEALWNYALASKYLGCFDEAKEKLEFLISLDTHLTNPAKELLKKLKNN